MGKTFERIDAALETFIRAQQMFFVATAPLGATGHVNISPKGLDTLRVHSPTFVSFFQPNQPAAPLFGSRSRGLPTRAVTACRS